MKKFERNLLENEQFNLIEESSKRLELSADEVANLSVEDIYDNIEVIETRLQVSEKELASLLANPNITSLEEAIKKCKDSLALHLDALSPDDVVEEIVFSGTTKLSSNADKVTVLKQKEKVWYELKDNFSVDNLTSMTEHYPELLINILSKALPKLTTSELRSFRTILNNLESAGIIIKKSETSISKSYTTKQLSLEDLDNLF